MKVLRLALLVPVLSACAGTKLPRPPEPPDAVEQLQQAAKKVDLAIVATKRMIQQSRGADYLPDMYMRLAELYVDRARYAWLTVYESRRSSDASRAIESPEARLLKNLAIGIYDRVLHEFPRFAHSDDALFLMAHEYRELGQFDEMRQTYDKLISNYPQSKHRLETYLILGDSEFDKSNLDAAESYYNLVLAEPTSRIHNLARYKLGWVRVNKEDCKGAVRLFEKILHAKSQTPAGEQLIVTQRNLNVNREALSDLAYCYPEVYGDKAPAPYFRALADNSSDYLAAMRRVANRFFLKQRYGPSAAALREVLAATVSDSEAVDTARKLYDNLHQGRIFDHAATDVTLFGRVAEEAVSDFRRPADKRAELGNEFEVYARDIATNAHLQAKKTHQTMAFSQAAGGYTAYLAYFGNSKSAPEIATNRAEALFAAHEFYATGQAFEKVASFATNAEEAKQARLNAISSYQQALDQGKLDRFQRVSAWGGIRVLGQGLIADSPNDPKLSQIKYAVAKTYYDAGAYQRAAELFYAIARQYPSSEEALASGQLALDALRLAEDWEGLRTLGNRMLQDPQLSDAKFKKEIADIVAKTEQRQLTELTVLSGQDRDEKLLSFAKRNKGSGLGEQALFNALVVARDGNDYDRFVDLSQEFIEQYPRSQKRVTVMQALANVASDRADYPQAAEILEGMYETQPMAKEGIDYLFGAANIHAYLGDARVSADINKLALAKASHRLDELLMTIARSGNLSAVEQIVSQSNMSGPTVEFFRGYFAYDRGDREEAQRHLSEAARGHDTSSADAVAKARFLLGELAYDNFVAETNSTEIAKAIPEKTARLNAVDQAYAQAIAGGEPAWALAGLTRVADAYQKYAAFMRDLKLPDDISAAEAQEFRKIITQKADEAEKRSQDMRNLAVKKATNAKVFSDSVRACLVNEPLPDKIPLFPRATSRHDNELQAALPLRQALQKQPKNIETLAKLAELYIGSGDLGMALLVLDHAGAVDTTSATISNLRGVALQKAGDADGAYEAFKKAADIDSANPRYRLNLAAHLLLYGYNKEADAEFKKAGGSFSAKGDVSEHPDLSVLNRLTNPGEKP